MTQVIIQDETPRTQLIASAGQTVFNTIWTADVATDIEVYARADGVEADDATQLVSPTLYNVSFVGVNQTVRVTFLAGRALDDIITIVRNTPAERLNLYINTNFTPSMLNQDFGILTLVDQQNQMYDSVVNPGYNVSETIDPIIDRILPILDVDQFWVMNSSRTKIVTFTLPSGGFAPADAKYILQTSNIGLPNAQAMGSLNSGLVVNTSITGVQLTRVLTDVSNQTAITNADGISGNPIIGIANNAKLPGVEGIGIPVGTTAQRPLVPLGTNLRFNSDLAVVEYWDGSNWVQISIIDGVSTAQGTQNQVLVNGTFGTQEDGDIILSLPQDIATSSTPTFDSVITNSIKSSTGNIIVSFLDSLNAVNYIGVLNGATTIPAEIFAQGSDANIHFHILTKGTGELRVFTESPTTPMVLYNGTLSQHATIFDMANTAQTRVVTFQDADGTLAYLSDIPTVTPSALTKVDDFNVTAVLGGNPNTALLEPVSITIGWSGELSPVRGGTGVNNGTSTLTLGGSLSTIGAFTSDFTMTGNTAVTFPTSGTLATTSQLVTPAAFTKMDDTNVTATLAGNPATALVNAMSFTLGWTGLLSIARGGTGISSFGTGVQTALGQNVTGTGGIALANSPTFVTPTLGAALATSVRFSGTDFILDSNGNNLLSQNATASAVNNITVYNGAINDPVSFRATGSDADIAFNIHSKGLDGISLMTGALTTPLTILSGTSSQHSTAFAFSNTAATRTVTFPDDSGTVLFAAGSGGLKSFQAFSAGAGTYTKPAGITSIIVEMIGAGGAGGGVDGQLLSVGAGGGGGSGGYVRHYIATAAASYSYSVGAGGSVGATGNFPGGNGGDTTFSTLTASGGIGGSGTTSAGSSVSNGGNGGAASGGFLFNTTGTPGSVGVAVPGAAAGGKGGGSYYGDGANGPFATSGSANGNDAQATYGGGGSGGISLDTTNVRGGAGANGRITVWEFA